ncbi:hypothetical protein JTE90_011324 [Oedothorax gibbosus]|uniref:Proton-coupled folate transporter n=1 Tax=Oedothorax gibbosus TaxID=931172 RepID=A0AAV6VKR6_9ARAC|nr:hypothetical protein JTE90_011324 [Oedothorax gibbosus]
MDTNKYSNIRLSKENILTDCLHKTTTELKDGQNGTQYGSTKEEDVPSILEADSTASSNFRKIDAPLKDVASSINGDDEPVIIETNNKTVSCCTKLKSLTIEPFVFAFLFAYYVNKSCLTNMIMDKGCLYTLNFTKDVCRNLSGHQTEKALVEILGNNYTLYANLLQIFGAFQTMFIAPWSDKYGRKLPILLAVVGMILSEIGLMFSSIYFDSALYFIIIARIPTELFGGFICTLTTVYSHASEVSSEEGRALKYAFVDIAMGLGMALGGLAGGLMFSLGYVYLFLTALLIHCMCLPWILFCVRETTGLDSNHTWREKIRNFFLLESFLKGWKAAVRKRENNGRTVLLMLFASMCVITLTIDSFSALGFVFIHHWYDWDQGKYNTIQTYFNVSQFIFLGICMPVLFRKFKLSGYFMGMVGVISMMGQYGLIGLSMLSIYLFYLGNVVGSMYGLSRFLIRTIISKLADKDELGRVFSFLATCEAILPMFGSILVTKVFNATLDTFPNVTYMMTVGFLILPMGTLGWLYLRSRRNTVTSTTSS